MSQAAAGGAAAGSSAATGAGAGAGVGAGGASDHNASAEGVAAAEQRQGLLPVASTMSREDLIIEVERQRRNVVVLQGEVKKLRASAAKLAARSEFDEEMLAHKLMKRVSAEGGPSRPGRGVTASRFGAGRAAGSPAESQRTSRLETQLRQMRQERVDAEHKLEQEQEFLVNKFQRQMNTLMASKRNLESQLEDERRRVNSTPTAARQLQAQLRRLQMEKVELENQLEAEQEAIVNKLQKRLRQAEEQKCALEKRLSVDVDETSAAVFKQLDELRGSSTLSVTQLAAVEAIRKEVQSLCRKLVDTKGELAQSRRDTQVAEARVQSLQQQAFVLQQRIHMEQERSAAHQSQTSRMAASLEADSERQFNVLSRGDSSLSGEELGRGRAGSIDDMSRSAARFVRSASGTHLAAAAIGSVGAAASRSPSPSPAAVVARDAAAFAGLPGSASSATARRASFQALFDDDFDAVLMGMQSDRDSRSDRASSVGSRGSFNNTVGLGSAAAMSPSARTLAALTASGSALGDMSTGLPTRTAPDTIVARGSVGGN